MQTDSIDGAQAAVGQRPLGTALLLLNKYAHLKHKHAAAGQTPPWTLQTAVATRTRPGKAQRRDTFKSSTGRHRRDTRPEAAQAVVEQTSPEAAQSVKEETHVQKQHMLLENRQVQRPQSAIETQTSSKVCFRAGMSKSRGSKCCCRTGTSKGSTGCCTCT